MALPAINEPRDLWVCDGSYRDVYIQHVTLADWETLVSVGIEHGLRYWRDGKEQALPAINEIFENREHTHFISFWASSVRLNCHFFTSGEIELDIDPREVGGPEDHYAVLRLLERLARETNKKILLTAENSLDAVLLAFDPSTLIWLINEPKSVL